MPPALPAVLGRGWAGFRVPSLPRTRPLTAGAEGSTHRASLGATPGLAAGDHPSPSHRAALLTTEVATGPSPRHESPVLFFKPSPEDLFPLLPSGGDLLFHALMRSQVDCCLCPDPKSSPQPWRGLEELPRKLTRAPLCECRLCSMEMFWKDARHCPGALPRTFGRGDPEDEGDPAQRCCRGCTGSQC